MSLLTFVDILGVPLFALCSLTQCGEVHKEYGIDRKTLSDRLLFLIVCLCITVITSLLWPLTLVWLFLW
jgi:hypothetical protein